MYDEGYFSPFLICYEMNLECHAWYTHHCKADVRTYYQWLPCQSFVGSFESCSNTWLERRSYSKHFHRTVYPPSRSHQRSELRPWDSCVFSINLPYSFLAGYICECPESRELPKEIASETRFLFWWLSVTEALSEDWVSFVLGTRRQVWSQHSLFTTALPKYFYFT
jgi:hypothetical protein